jgi:hypothetical protein
MNRYCTERKGVGEDGEDGEDGSRGKGGKEGKMEGVK